MGFPINPPRVALVNQQGIVTPEWYSFFVEIQKLIGTSQTNPFDDSTLLGINDSGSDAPQPVYLLSVLEPGTLTAGAGVTGGGNMGGNVTINVGAGAGITVNADDVALDTASTRNTDHAAVTLTAGDGLTGGGTIEASRTFAVGAGTGITVAADAVSLSNVPGVAGTYAPPASISVDAQGRITAIS